MQSVLNKLFYYQIYGITLSSNLPLPLLIATSTATATADVVVHLEEAKSPPDILEQEYTDSWFQRQKDDGVYHCLLLYNNEEYLETEISPNGQQIQITWINQPLAEVTAILIGCILGTALRLQGKLCLHSSVIAVDNYAIAIIGEQGAGKSTTAAAFTQRGYPVLADDIAVLVDDGEKFLVQPGYPRLRLWKSAVNELYGSAENLPKVFSDTDKHFVELNQSLTMSWCFQSRSLPLAAIYILGERQQQLTFPSIEACIPQVGLMHLMIHRYPQSFNLNCDTQSRDFAVLGHLATTVPIRYLHRADCLAELPKVCDAILSDITNIHCQQFKQTTPLILS
jgi:hypothetical protein